MDRSTKLSPKQALRDFVYVAAGLPLGLIWWCVLIALLSSSLSLAVVVIGIPLLMVTMLVWRWGANMERERAALVLGAPIAPARRNAPTTDSFWSRWKARLVDRTTWRDLGYMVLLGPVGMISGALVIAFWAAALAALAAPLAAQFAADGSWLGRTESSTLTGLAIASIPLSTIALLVDRGLAIATGAFARIMLASDDRAELTDRISSLETTRQGAVESADARLRRIERDLHDGAQHRLAYIAMEIGRARAKLAPDDKALDELLAGAHEESKRAMRELRDVVRGIHPSVLTDRGLDAALSGLAERASVPVEIIDRLDPRRRLPPAVETAAYYVAAETLTNIGRHSRATRAEVEIERDGDEVVLMIRDDGIGGAARSHGSGLEGLAQRVEAIDGTFIIQSPAGGPTTISARFPCAL